MSQQNRVSHPICNLPTEIEGFDSLAELALDMRPDHPTHSWAQHLGDNGNGYGIIRASQIPVRSV